MRMLFHVGTKSKYLDLAIVEIADCLLDPLTSVGTTPYKEWPSDRLTFQAETGKIYRLKQHFLLSATARSVTKIKYTVSCLKKYASCDPIRSSQKKRKYIRKNKKYAQPFSLITLFDPRTYTQIHTPTVVQRGGGRVDGTLPPEFSICCSIFETIFPLVERP